MSNPRTVRGTAIALEELGVAAYNGQATNLSKPALQAAASIVSVNARHAAWIRAIQEHSALRASRRTSRDDAAAGAPAGRPHGIREGLAECISTSTGSIATALCARRRPVVPRETRKDFLLSTLAGGGAALAALALAEPGRAQSKTDVEILNYALTLEYLQAAFYTEAEQRRALRTKLAKQTTRVLGAVERAHVTALQDALGSAAVKKPSFDFGGVTEDEDAFIKTAVAFEDLGTAAYKGQAYRVDSPAAARRGGLDPLGGGASRRLDQVPRRRAARASSALDEPKSMSRGAAHRRVDGLHRAEPEHASLRRSRDSLADASPCPRRWSGGARRRRRSRTRTRRARHGHVTAARTQSSLAAALPEDDPLGPPPRLGLAIPQPRLLAAANRRGLAVGASPPPARHP